MGNKVTTLYDFTLTANGSQQIQADANFYKILTASGDVSITRDGGSTVKPMRAGRGERNVKFLTLTIRDLSGAPNSGTILVGDSDFIDDTIVLSSAINVRPEAPTTAFATLAALAANTAEQIFAPGANAGGAIILSAGSHSYSVSGPPIVCLLSKAGAAPTSVADGTVYASSLATAGNSANHHGSFNLPKLEYVPAGHGLYFISTLATIGSTWELRHCRFKFL